MERHKKGYNDLVLCEVVFRILDSNPSSVKDFPGPHFQTTPICHKWGCIQWSGDKKREEAAVTSVLFSETWGNGATAALSPAENWCFKSVRGPECTQNVWEALIVINSAADFALRCKKVGPSFGNEVCFQTGQSSPSQAESSLLVSIQAQTRHP